MQRALVIGASGGIGGAVFSALETRGVAATGLSRADGLNLMNPNVAMDALDGVFDLIFIATGILAPEGGAPEKSLSAVEPVAMAEVLKVNAIGPTLILSQVPRLLPREGRSVVAVLTARVGSIGDNAMGGWYSYRASKAAANQIVHTAAIEIGRKHREAVVVAMHPGTVETPFTQGYPAHKKVSADQAASNLLDVIDQLRPDQSGGFFDYAGAEIPW